MHARTHILFHLSNERTNPLGQRSDASGKVICPSHLECALNRWWPKGELCRQGFYTHFIFTDTWVFGHWLHSVYCNIGVLHVESFWSAHTWASLDWFDLSMIVAIGAREGAIEQDVQADKGQRDEQLCLCPIADWPPGLVRSERKIKLIERFTLNLDKDLSGEHWQFTEPNTATTATTQYTELFWHSNIRAQRFDEFKKI